MCCTGLGWPKAPLWRGVCSTPVFRRSQPECMALRGWPAAGPAPPAASQHFPPLPARCSGEWLEMPEGKVDRALLEAAGEQLNSALTNPFFGML